MIRYRDSLIKKWLCNGGGSSGGDPGGGDPGGGGGPSSLQPWHDAYNTFKGLSIDPSVYSNSVEEKIRTAGHEGKFELFADLTQGTQDDPLGTDLGLMVAPVGINNPMVWKVSPVVNNHVYQLYVSDPCNFQYRVNGGAWTATAGTGYFVNIQLGPAGENTIEFAGHMGRFDIRSPYFTDIQNWGSCSWNGFNFNGESNFWVTADDGLFADLTQVEGLMTNSFNACDNIPVCPGFDFSGRPSSGSLSGFFRGTTDAVIARDCFFKSGDTIDLFYFQSGITACLWTGNKPVGSMVNAFNQSEVVDWQQGLTFNEATDCKGAFRLMPVQTNFTPRGFHSMASGEDMFLDTVLQSYDIDGLLADFAANNTNTDVPLHLGSGFRTSNSDADWDILVNGRNWSITVGGRIVV
jgi:hypothetical protein